MNPLEELLAAIADLSTVEDLDALLGQAREITESLRSEPVTDETVAALQQVADAVEAIKAEKASREQAETERQAKAQEALDKIAAALAEPDDDPGEPADGDDTADDDAKDEGKVPVAAAGTKQPVVSKVAARRPSVFAPTPKPDKAPVALIAAGSAEGVQPGDDVTGQPDKIAALLLRAYETSRGYRGPVTKVPIVRTFATFPDERFLDGDRKRNADKIAAVTSLSALAASGGICAPTPVRYDLPITDSSAARPFRDALARFGADRGGIRTLPPPILSDLEGAVDVWTEANDQSPADPTTKPCLTVTCPEDDDETVVEAITRCLKFGNFRARYFPEQVEAWLALLDAQHARQAENRLIATVGAGSTQITTGADGLGTTRDVLAHGIRAATAFRSRHRLPRTYPMRWMWPEWLIDNMRVDLARQMPVGTLAETLAVAEAAIVRFFEVNNLNVSTFMDGEAGQVFGAQGDGLLNPWPTSVVTYMFVEGSWLFLDGGALDLGLFRDSTLVGTNDVQMFAETFEEAHFHGVESFRITMDVCPSGKAAALEDFDPCSSGS